MAPAEVKRIKVFVVEEQAIYQEVYRIVFSPIRETKPPAGITSPIELLGIASDIELKKISQAIDTAAPDVLLLSTKRITANIVTILEQIRSNYPDIGMALFLMFYCTEDIELLRKVAQRGEGGMALFLKQSVDLSEQMCGIILAVSQGQVILDPALSTLLFTGKPECPVLNQLTARELEILSLLARGLTNGAIADSLYIDVKTVEHHINSMYSKLKTSADFNFKHSRVSAARLYLEATGELVTPVIAH